MKTYDEIKTDMQEVYNEIRKLEEEKKSLIWNKKDITAYKTYTENLHNINFQILILNLKYEILQNNRNCAMYNQVMPMAFEVLKKYFSLYDFRTLCSHYSRQHRIMIEQSEILTAFMQMRNLTLGIFNRRII